MNIIRKFYFTVNKLNKFCISFFPLRIVTNARILAIKAYQQKVIYYIHAVLLIINPIDITVLVFNFIIKALSFSLIIQNHI